MEEASAEESAGIAHGEKSRHRPKKQCGVRMGTSRTGDETFGIRVYVNIWVLGAISFGKTSRLPPPPVLPYAGDAGGALLSVLFVLSCGVLFRCRFGEDSHTLRFRSCALESAEGGTEVFGGVVFLPFQRGERCLADPTKDGYYFIWLEIARTR